MIQPASASVLPMAAAAQSSSVSANVMPAVADTGAAEVIQVRSRHYHRYHHRHHHHRHRGAGAFGAGLAVGLVGALIAKGVTESSARSRFAQCARDFRSFDPETGTYITSSGRERLCPYLR
jgi:hypothetical protein